MSFCYMHADRLKDKRTYIYPPLDKLYGPIISTIHFDIKINIGNSLNMLAASISSCKRDAPAAEKFGDVEVESPEAKFGDVEVGSCEASHARSELGISLLGR